jgi:hypothetical protein
MTEASKAVDDCEHIYMMGDSQTGAGMALLNWRDEAAMKAAAHHIAADKRQAGGPAGRQPHPRPSHDMFAEL